MVVFGNIKGSTSVFIGDKITGQLAHTLNQSFLRKTIQSILQSFFKDEKTKMTSEAIHLSRELIGIFITEAIMRSCKEAGKDDSTTVAIEHLEKILPQLLLDF